MNRSKFQFDFHSFFPLSLSLCVSFPLIYSALIADLIVNVRKIAKPGNLSDEKRKFNCDVYKNSWKKREKKRTKAQRNSIRALHQTYKRKVNKTMSILMKSCGIHRKRKRIKTSQWKTEKKKNTTQFHKIFDCWFFSNQIREISGDGNII